MDSTRALDQRQIDILQQLSRPQASPPDDLFLDDILEFSSRGLITASRKRGFVLSPKGHQLLAELH
jgi:hypothetical protein